MSINILHWSLKYEKTLMLEQETKQGSVREVIRSSKRHTQGERTKGASRGANSEAQEKGHKPAYLKEIGYVRLV